MYQRISYRASTLVLGMLFMIALPELVHAQFRYSTNNGSITVTGFYSQRTTGWGATFGGRPTALWNPEINVRDASFGVQQKQFGFDISGTGELIVVVEASADLTNPIWIPVGTNSFGGGSSYFADPKWAEYPMRAYRLRFP